MIATETKFMSIDDIKDEEFRRGSHWFEKGTMSFFKSRVSDTTYCGVGGIYFVTSEQTPHGPRMYSVRRYDPHAQDQRCKISTIGDFCAIDTRAQAHGAAKRYAAGKED